MISADSLPRVLAIGQPFERTTGGGITLSNLFEGWPSDRLRSAEVAGAEPTFDVCTARYLLGRDEIGWIWPLSAVTRTQTRLSGPMVASADGSVPVRATASEPPSTATDRGALAGASAVFRSAVDASGLEHVLRRMSLSPALARWIEDFRPQVVYSQLSDLPVMSLVEDVLETTGAAFVLHVMDDWPTTMYRHGALSLLARRRAMTKFRRLLARARSRMAIGDSMACEYERRYGAAFIGIQNPTDLAARDALAARYAADFRRDDERLVVLYAGRIGTANAESLELVARAVAGMAESGTPIVLRIHTPNADHPFIARMSRMPGVDVLPPVPYDRMPALLDSVDVLLLPLDFGDEAMRFASLSMPTKIPEYLAAARPVLTIAPRASAAGGYAAAGTWSLLVDEPDASAVRAALERLAAEPALRTEMGQAGRGLAQRDHDARAVRERFALELCRAAEEGRH